jgi:hypothetical protein
VRVAADERRLFRPATLATLAGLLLAACTGKVTTAAGEHPSTDTQPDGAGTVLMDAGPAVDATLDVNADSGSESDVATGDAPTAPVTVDAPVDVADAGAEWSQPLWAVQSWALTTDHAGNLLAVGEGSNGPFVAKLAPDGRVLWMPKFVANGQDMANGVAVDSADDIIISGFNSTGTVDFGGGPIGPGTYVAKFTSSGALLWSEILSSVARYAVVAVAPTDEILVCGSLWGMPDFPGDAGLSLDASTGGYVVKLDESGNALWATPTVASDGVFSAAAADGTGGVVCTSFNLSADHVGADGAIVGSYQYPLGQYGQGIFSDVKVTPLGDVLLVGGWTPSTAPWQGLFIHLTAAMDVVASAAVGHGPGDLEATGIVIDEDGGIAISGETDRAGADFGGGPLDASGPFVVVLAGDGGYLGGRLWNAGSTNVNQMKIALAPSPDYFLFGELTGPVDLGQGAFGGNGLDGGAVFLAREGL